MVAVDWAGEIFTRILALFLFPAAPVVDGLGNNGGNQAAGPFQLHTHHFSHNDWPAGWQPVAGGVSGAEGEIACVRAVGLHQKSPIRR